MRYSRTLLVAAVMAAAFLTSEAFAVPLWSDGGPEAFPLTYPPETATVREGFRAGVTPDRTFLVSETSAVPAWSDGGPEAYPLKYPPEAAKMHEGFRARRLIGKTIGNTEGNDLGSVRDLLVAENGLIKYVILDEGGILGRGLLGRGIGDEMYAVPWSAIRVDSMDRRLTLDMSRETLKIAPKFMRGEWAKLDDPAFEGKVYGYYGVKDLSRSPAMMVGKDRGTYLASSFMGAFVKDARGMELGKVHDFVTGEDGRVDYVVVSHREGLFGIVRKLTPVPWKSAKLDSSDHTITITVEKDRFMGAPRIKGDDWSRFDNADWTKKVEGYYGG